MLRRFFVDTLVYSIPVILSRGIGFFLLPIYTRYLSPTEYGILELLTVSYALLALVLPLEVSQAVGRFLPDVGGQDQKVDYASTAFWFTGAVFSLLAVICWVAPGSFALLLFGDSTRVLIVRFGALWMLGNSLMYLIQIQLRFNMQSTAYTATSVVFALLTALISVALLVIFHFGILGPIIGRLIGALGSVLLGLVVLRRTIPIRLRFKKEKLKQMLTFSGPLVLSSMSVYGSLYIDRWMLRAWLGLEDVGIYTVAYRVASILALAIVAFQMALTPLVYRHYRDPQTPFLLDRILGYFLLLVCPLIALTATFSREILGVLAAATFQEAASLVFWLSVAVVLMNVYVFAPGLALAKKTKATAALNVLACFANLMANSALIPFLGRLGAALGTLLGACVMATLYFRWGHREYPIPYRKYQYLSIATLTIIYCMFISLVDISITNRYILWMSLTFCTSISLLHSSDVQKLLTLIRSTCGASTR